MPITYTKVPKPTGTIYANVNPAGREQYDQSTIRYDDPNVFYDGINYSQYTKITKPAGTSYTKVVKPT